MLDTFLGGWLGFRARWRGLLLPAFALPLVPAALFAAFAGDERMVAGAAAGLVLSVLAARRLRRGRAGDLRRASWLMAAGAGLAAHFAAGLGAIVPFLAAAGALFGTRMLYAELPESAPPPQPVAPPPPTPVSLARARLAAISATAASVSQPRLAHVADAMRGVLDDLDARPERLPQARRFLAVHLDGLERIADRLAAGAAPPASLPVLLEDMTTAAGSLREALRREESEALDVQVKVLSDRLREEGI